MEYIWSFRCTSCGWLNDAFEEWELESIDLQVQILSILRNIFTCSWLNWYVLICSFREHFQDWWNCLPLRLIDLGFLCWILEEDVHLFCFLTVFMPNFSLLVIAYSRYLRSCKVKTNKIIRIALQYNWKSRLFVGVTFNLRQDFLIHFATATWREIGKKPIYFIKTLQKYLKYNPLKWLS